MRVSKSGRCTDQRWAGSHLGLLCRGGCSCIEIVLKQDWNKLSSFCSFFLKQLDKKGALDNADGAIWAACPEQWDHMDTALWLVCPCPGMVAAGHPAVWRSGMTWTWPEGHQWSSSKLVYRVGCGSWRQQRLVLSVRVRVGCNGSSERAQATTHLCCFLAGWTAGTAETPIGLLLWCEETCYI